jgi:hypothetical protein
MARQRAVESAVDAWREAERRLAEATPGTAAHIDAATAADEARLAYAAAAAERYDETAALAELHADDDLLDAATLSH